MDIIETVFLKEGCIGHASGGKGDGPALTVKQTASAAAAGLRMLDGVRMLGPSLAKLCDMPIGDGNPEQPSIAAILCISIHRTTVKNTARTLENLSKAIQEDPVKSQQRVKDARVAPLTCDVVRAVRAVRPGTFSISDFSDFPRFQKSFSKAPVWTRVNVRLPRRWRPTKHYRYGTLL